MFIKLHHLILSLVLFTATNAAMDADYEKAKFEEAKQVIRHNEFPEVLAAKLEGLEVGGIPITEILGGQKETEEILRDIGRKVLRDAEDMVAHRKYLEQKAQAIGPTPVVRQKARDFSGIVQEATKRSFSLENLIQAQKAVVRRNGPTTSELQKRMRGKQK